MKKSIWFFFLSHATSIENSLTDILKHSFVIYTPCMQCNCLATPLPVTTIYKHDHLKSNSKMVIIFILLPFLSLSFFLWLFQGYSAEPATAVEWRVAFISIMIIMLSKVCRVSRKGRNKPKYTTTTSFFQVVL